MKEYDRKRKKKEKANQIIIALILSFLMVGSMLGIMLNEDDQTFKYKDYKFRLTDQGYTSKINGKQFYFSYLPDEIEQFEITDEYCQNLKSVSQINILFEPETQSSGLLDFIRLDMRETYDTNIISSITTNSTRYPTYDVMSCDNATALTPIIFFKEGDNASLKTENNCLIAQAEGREFLIFRDRILYCYTGVI